MKVFKTVLLPILLFIFNTNGNCQDLAIKTKILEGFTSSTDQAYEFKLFDIGYNSFHWQAASSIIVEVFQQAYSPAYAKYVINLGYGFGVNYGNMQLLQVENYGNHLFSVSFGHESDLNTSHFGYPNKRMPVLLKVKPYIQCSIKVTYTHNEVTNLSSLHEISFPATQSGSPTADFPIQMMVNTPLWTTSNLRVEGDDNIYIMEGNLGIGTKKPQEKLSVSGKILAHEIRVTTAANDWPDYVFHKDYNLSPLKDIEAFILQNGHLPEVPSTAEARENGISLGEINKVLLKKIEELTLYAIEAKKQLDDQSTEIKKLKNRLPK